MVATPDILRTLRLFSEKADKLLANSAAERALKRLASNVHWDRQQGWTGSYDGPDGESVDAFVLTLRLFIQNNEPISLANMRELYAESAPADHAERFASICADLNAFLDSCTPIAISEAGPLTYRELLDFFVYGDLAHTHAAKRAGVAAFRAGEMFPLFQFHLAATYRAFVMALTMLNRVNKDVLEASGPAA